MRGLYIVIAVLVIASAFAMHRKRVDGRVKEVRDDDADVLTATDIGGELGASATLVQFSTAFCQPCRATRRVLGEVADMVPGVAHVEVDAEANLDLVNRLGVHRVPTIVVLDSTGRVAKTAVGQPRKPDVIAALGDVIEPV